MDANDSTTSSWSNIFAPSVLERRISFDRLDRLRSVFDQLPLDGLPRRLLNVGCGDYPSLPIVTDTLPAWTSLGLDLDLPALRRAARRLPRPPVVQADAARLPFARNASFGLIMVRHPDVFRRRTAWSRLLPTLAGRLAPNGLLVITVFTGGEVALIRRLPLPPHLALNETALASPDVAGHDRFVLAFRVPPAL